MSSLYLILLMATPCPTWPPSNFLNVTPTGFNTQVGSAALVAGNSIPCGSGETVSFTTDRAKAETALEHGRVWEVDAKLAWHNVSFGVQELARVSSTTYSVQSKPLAVTP